MSFDRYVKTFKRAAARRGLFASAWILERMPFGMVDRFARALIAVGFRLTVRQRRIARESLQIAFGAEKSRGQIAEIIRRCFENLGHGMIEMLYFMAHPELTDQRVLWEGREHLDRALAQGRGVIAVTAHFGNFPLMMLCCARQGYKTSAIIRPARDEVLERYLLRRRGECGVNTVYAVPRRECVSNSLRSLSGGHVLFIPLDQNFGSGTGVFVDFFGQQAATATGPVVFARRSKAPVVPMFIIRQQDGKHRIIVEPPFALEERADEDEAVSVNIAKLTRLIEQYIRRYPHEWGWMHRRWKSKPAEKVVSGKS
ncbi:MAG: lysophospholipid acyltransferase family protein [Candidatus Omnitrophica bacterium]|nr:lysophospholipid acyltransferase family protein [Candidatus Omnitrophota bacterium]